MPDTRRLFFAIPIPSTLQQAIIAWRAATFSDSVGRPVPAANLHLTLAFLGDVSTQKQHVLTRLAERIAQPAFSLTLDDAGHWLRSRVIRLGTRRPEKGLLSLAGMLRAQAARNGCYQSPQPFHPHVTLWRDAAQHVPLPPPGFQWQFSVTEYVLYESRFQQGRTRYIPLIRFPLNP